MYVLTVIPITNRPVPGTLSYYSEIAHEKGAVLSVPIGNSSVWGLVANSQTLASAKSLIRSAPYAIKKIPKATPLVVLPEAVLLALSDTAAAYLAPPHHVAHALVPGMLITHLEQTGALPEAKSISIYPTWRDAAYASVHGEDSGTLLHSRLTEKQQLKIFAGDHDRIITTPAFAWVYMLGGAEATLAEPSHEHYYRPRAPWFDYAYFLERLAHHLAAPIKESAPEFTLDSGRLTPIDAPLDDKLGYAIVIHPNILRKIHEYASKGEKVLVISPRTGFATGVRCRDCGTVAHDESTGDRFRVTEKEPGVFVYDAGHREKAAAHTCQTCGGTNLIMFGFGTAAYDKILSRNFSQFPYSLITKDTGKRALTAADEQSGGLVLGTWSAVAHLSPGSYHTVLLGLEFLFGIPGVYQFERVLGQLDRLHARSRTLSIARHDAKHPTLGALFDGSWADLAATEAKLRQALGYPPHGVSALVSAIVRRGAGENIKHHIGKVLGQASWSWYVRPSQSYTEEIWLTFAAPDTETMRRLMGAIVRHLPEAQIRLNPRSI